MLLHSMPTSSEPDSSGSQGDLKIGTTNNSIYKTQIRHDLVATNFHHYQDPISPSLCFSPSLSRPSHVQNSMVPQFSVEFVVTKQVDFIMEFTPAKDARLVHSLFLWSYYIMNNYYLILSPWFLTNYYPQKLIHLRRMQGQCTNWEEQVWFPSIPVLIISSTGFRRRASAAAHNLEPRVHSPNLGY